MFETQDENCRKVMRSLDIGYAIAKDVQELAVDIYTTDMVGNTWAGYDPTD